MIRPDFIRHYTDIQRAFSDGVNPDLDGRGSPFRELGLVKLGIHYEVIAPGHRSSFPHAESHEEEFVFVIQGKPDAWTTATSTRWSPVMPSPSPPAPASPTASSTIRAKTSTSSSSAKPTRTRTVSTIRSSPPAWPNSPAAAKPGSMRLGMNWGRTTERQSQGRGGTNSQHPSPTRTRGGGGTRERDGGGAA